MVLGKC